MRKDKNTDPRLGAVGGQAVMEGVMMKSRTDMAVAVRNDKGNIVVRTKKVTSVRDKCKPLGWPVIRGVVNFAEMLILSYSTLTSSMEMAGLDKIETESKFDKWVDKHFGKHMLAIVGVIGGVLGVALAVGMFLLLPMWLAKLIDTYLFTLGWAFSLVEGVFKMILFISYLALITLMPDVKRLFMYHGAEHKSIFCYEKGLELNVENVKKQKRFHPRCGTSFIFVILAISIVIGSFIPHDIGWLRFVLKLAVIPVIVGIGYEFIRYAGKHENVCTRFFSAPGLWMQRITTKEPDEKMIEVAIVSIKSALHDEFPEFEIPYEVKEEEKGQIEETPGAGPTEQTEQTEQTESENVNDDDR